MEKIRIIFDEKRIMIQIDDTFGYKARSAQEAINICRRYGQQDNKILKRHNQSVLEFLPTEEEIKNGKYAVMNEQEISWAIFSQDYKTTFDNQGKFIALLKSEQEQHSFHDHILEQLTMVKDYADQPIYCISFDLKGYEVFRQCCKSFKDFNLQMKKYKIVVNPLQIPRFIVLSSPTRESKNAPVLDEARCK